jgi:hypothetical protein
MYKTMYPYNKFVSEKNNKPSKHPIKIYILQIICNNKIDISKLFSNYKMADLLKMKNP